MVPSHYNWVLYKMTISLSKTYFVACTLCFVTLFTLSKVFFCSVCIALFSRSREDQISKLSSLHLNFYNLSRSCSLDLSRTHLFIYLEPGAVFLTISLWTFGSKKKKTKLMLFCWDLSLVLSGCSLNIFSKCSLSIVYICVSKLISNRGPFLDFPGEEKLKQSFTM